MIIEKIWKLLKQKKCNHSYKKRWNREKKTYTLHCVNCGKEKEYESK